MINFDVVIKEKEKNIIQIGLKLMMIHTDY